jgi:co-chaperonin GroES (HSP10)
VQAIGFNAVVAIEAIDERSKGGIILPDSERDKKDVTAMRGRLVSLGEAAFDYAKFDEPPLKVGDAVMIASLAGKRITGVDDKHYRIMTDRDLIGRIVEDAS